MADETIIDRGDDVKSPLDDAGKDTATEVKDTKTDDAEVKDKLDDETETAEEKAEREKQEAEEARKRAIRIPKHRFDEAQAKARQREQALLAEIQQLKSGQQTRAVQDQVAEARTKIDELQDKYEDLITDGKKEDARKVRKQIDAMRDVLLEYQTTTKSDAARRQALDEMTYNQQLASLEVAYPQLNPENEAAFDEDATNEVAELMKAMVKSGKTRAEALRKAAKYVLGDPPEKSAAKDKDDDKTKAAEKTRAEEARKKAADANKKQPPNMNQLGKDSDKGGKKDGDGEVDVMKLTQSKFAKLDEETLAKLRGDVAEDA
jgi:hypothetical protein